MSAPAELPFRHLLRVRYLECDAQKIVFNARWGDYVDVAVTEFTRTVWGAVELPGGLDFRLVRQVLEWKAPARFDDILEARVRCIRIGTTSFSIGTEFRRWGSEPVLATAETTYVVVDAAAGAKQPIPEPQRAALERGAPGVIVDHAGAGIPAA